MKALPLLLALCAPALFAQPVTAVVDPGASVLAYTGRHPAHDWTGTSRAVSGTVRVDPEVPALSRISLRVPVRSFDSGNGARDAKMRSVVDADAHPDVAFVSDRVEVERWRRTAEGYGGAWRVHGRLTFHGRTRDVVIPVEVRVADERLEAEAAFEVSLEDFDVKRPRLIVPIRNTIRLEGTIRAALPEPAASL